MNTYLYLGVLFAGQFATAMAMAIIMHKFKLQKMKKAALRDEAAKQKYESKLAQYNDSPINRNPLVKFIFYKVVGVVVAKVVGKCLQIALAKLGVQRPVYQIPAAVLPLFEQFEQFRGIHPKIDKQLTWENYHKMYNNLVLKVIVMFMTKISTAFAKMVFPPFDKPVSIIAVIKSIAKPAEPLERSTKKDD